MAHVLWYGIDRDDYLAEGYRHLSDAETYKEVSGFKQELLKNLFREK